MNIETWKIDRIKPYKDNPRVNRQAVEPVAQSIRTFGFQQPLVVDEQGVILAGHTRWAAARKLKLNEVPVVVASDLTPDQARAYRLADNKTAELADWEPASLARELDALQTQFDMSLFGFVPLDETIPSTTSRVPVIPEIFEVAVRCENEEDQKMTYEKLVADGYSCRLLNL